MDRIKRSNRRESSVLGGWLSSFYSEDSAGSAKAAARRRLLLGFALAVAIHEIIAGVFPWHSHTAAPTPKETITIAKLTRIEHRPRPTPKPTPHPTPKPTPVPKVHTKVIAETHVKPHIVNPGNPSQRQHIKRIASARPLVHTRYHSKPATIHVPTGGHGAGTSTKAKAETGGIGPGGTGTGESGTGQGTGGAPQAHEPCGFVEFLPSQQPRIDQATGRIWEYVSIRVHFPDGTQDTVDLDYPFYYPSESEDPFLPGHDNIPAAFQFPPPDKRASEPSLVQYVIQHTSSDGYTLLRDCPK